jgi:hypothetical protein
MTWREQAGWRFMVEVRSSQLTQFILSVFSLASIPQPNQTPFSLCIHLIKCSTNALPAIFGPAATSWFKFLQTRVKLPSANGTILARVACDQCIFAPTSLAVFLSTMAMLEGSKPQKKLDAAYKPALTKNWMVWPWVQMANFKFVPLEHRVLVVNVISLGEFLDRSLKTDGEYVDLDMARNGGRQPLKRHRLKRQLF